MLTFIAFIILIISIFNFLLLFAEWFILKTIMGALIVLRKDKEHERKSTNK